MNEKFLLFPEQASRHAYQIDNLYFFLLGITGFFTVLVCALIIVFSVKYRRKPGISDVKQRGGHVEENKIFEIIWSTIPLLIGLVIFGWATQLYLQVFTAAPKDAMEISVVGKQWMWKFEHPNGKREINELHLPINRAVKLIMISQDVVHGLSFPNFRMKHDVLPGKYTIQWFEPTKVGRYHIFCTQYCGTKHSEMTGWVYVMEQADYQAWLEGTPYVAASAEPMSGESGGGTPSGKALLDTLGCRQCHKPDSAQQAPVLEGMFGKQIKLKDGKTVAADENYIRESILDPQAKVVVGYESTMPTYRGRVSEEELLSIISYLKSPGNKP
jgi:cytochrome c oxidase subunit II